jgi:hypothetical protein
VDRDEAEGVNKPRQRRGRRGASKVLIKPGSAEDGDKRLFALQRDLIEMAERGDYDNDPEMKGRILGKYNPLLELAVIGTRAANDSQRILCNKIIADFTLIPLKAETDVERTTAIQITIAAWAGAALPASATKAIAAPAIEAEVVDVEARAHRINSAPTPAPDAPDYIEYQTSADPAVAPKVLRKIRLPKTDTNPFTGERWATRTREPDTNTQTSFDVFKE